MDWKQLGDEISQVTGEHFEIKTHREVSGGCVNSAYQIESSKEKYFVKLNTANKLAMFEAEAEGLGELAKANALRVPEAVCTGIIQSQSYIVMEALALGGRGSMQDFAEQLVKMHRYSHSQFGWHRENTIGSTLQNNQSTTDWQAFFNEHRLGFQLGLAKKNGANKRLLDKGERVQSELTKFFAGYNPEVSLLHGDLWSGNYAFTREGEPAVFDPATYYGDREADIAMTELFGGFSHDFYSHYNELWLLDSGYPIRKTLYNLYHILNHFNMFGGGYESQSEGMCDQLLAKT